MLGSGLFLAPMPCLCVWLPKGDVILPITALRVLTTGHLGEEPGRSGVPLPPTRPLPSPYLPSQGVCLSVCLALLPSFLHWPWMGLLFANLSRPIALVCQDCQNQEPKAWKIFSSASQTSRLRFPLELAGGRFLPVTSCRLSSTTVILSYGLHQRLSFSFNDLLQYTWRHTLKH